MNYHRFVITVMLGSTLLLGSHTQAQAPRPGTEAQPADPNALFAGLVNTLQSLSVAERCGWGQEIHIKAGLASLAIQTADLKAQVGNPQAHQQIDAGLAQARGQANNFSCQGADGRDAPQRAQLEPLIEDQYWRMVTHIDVFGGSGWGQPFGFSEADRAALDQEIADIKEVRGYGYYEVFNPLISIADRARPLVCRERQVSAITCAPVTPDLEPLLPIVQTILNETEQFARAVLQEKASRQAELLAAVNGQPEHYFAIDQSCRLGAQVVNIGQARLRAADDDSSSSWRQELALADTYILGQQEPNGWLLLYRLNTGSVLMDSPWHVVARSGSEWSYEDVLLPFEVPDELPDDLYEELLMELEYFDVELSDAEMAEAVREMNQTRSDSYMQTFLMNGSMTAMRGNQELNLQRCDML